MKTKTRLSSPLSRRKPRTVSIVRTTSGEDVRTVYYGSAPGAYTRPFGGK